MLFDFFDSIHSDCFKIENRLYLVQTLRCTFAAVYSNGLAMKRQDIADIPIL